MEIKNNDINDALKNMWDAAKKATEKIAMSNKKVNELQAQFDFLENTINQKNKKNEELVNRIKELEKNINEKNERITSQYTEIDSLIKQQEKYSELETSYFTTVNENQNLKNELENFINQKQELEKLYDEYKNVSEKFLKFESENNQLKKKLYTVEKEIRDYEIAKKELLNNRLEIISRNEQIDKIKIQLAESQSIVFNQNVKIKELTKNNEFLNEKNNLLSEKNNEFLNEKNKLEDEINKIISENNIEKMDFIAKILACQNELKDFYHTKIYLENLLQEKEEILKQVQYDSREEKKSFDEKINSIILEKDKIITEKNNFFDEKINSIILEKDKIIAEKNNTVVEYKNVIQQYEKEFEALKQIIKTTEEASVFKDKQLQENLKINATEIEKNNFENKKLKEKNEELEKINYALREKNAELQQKIILSDENDFVNKEKNTTELNNENERLRDIVAELNGELSKMQNEYKNTLGENTKFAKDNANLQNELQKIQKLTTAFESIKQTNEEQTNTITKLKNELKYYKKRVYDDESLFASENINLLGEVEIKYKQQIDDLNLEISRISSENKELLAKNNFLANELNEQKIAHQNEIKNQQKEFEKNISTVKNTSTVTVEKTAENDFDKNELVNKLENFVAKLEKKLEV